MKLKSGIKMHTKIIVQIGKMNIFYTETIILVNILGIDSVYIIVMKSKEKLKERVVKNIQKLKNISSLRYSDLKGHFMFLLYKLMIKKFQL